MFHLCFFHFQQSVYGCVIIFSFATPIPMDQFAWTRQETVANIGILMATCGVMMMLLYSIMGYIAKFVDERKLLIFFGIIPNILGQLLFTPVSSLYPQMHGNFTVGST